MESIQKNKKRLLGLMAIFLVPTVLLGVFIFSKDEEAGKTNPGKSSAFNDKMPAANLQDADKNKLEVYMQAQQDSLKLKDQASQDPYSRELYNPAPPDSAVEMPPFPHSSVSWNRRDANEQKVNDRVSKIMAVLNAQAISPPNADTAHPTVGAINSGEIEGLEQMLKSAQSTDAAPNPEMNQLEKVLDKILDIQYPERMKDRMAAAKTEQGRDSGSYPVTSQVAVSSNTGFPGAANPSPNTFYGLTAAVSISPEGTSFLATVYEQQKIQEGQTVKLRLLQNLFVGNTPIPKGQAIYGKCNISDGRVIIQIHEISFQNNVLPVQLKVYDQTDGLEGINIQGDLSEEISKNGVDQLIGQMQIGSMTTSVGAQAATSGIQTLKNLIGRKVKKITVTLKAGHNLILKPVQN